MSPGATRAQETLTTPFFAKRLAAAERTALLDRILRRVRHQAAESPAVVVFDLDGTLMDNRPRIAAILHELGEHWGPQYPDAGRCCARAAAEDVVYDFVENLQRLGVRDPALHKEGLAFWRARFFADSHIRHDVEVAGAAAYAWAVHEAGAVIVYLTGRDLPNMALGSFASLRDLGFPVGVVGSELVVKPRSEMPDAEFKRTVAPTLKRVGTVIAAFDNEAENVNLFLDAHPACIGVFLDTKYAPNPPPLDPRAHVISNFELDP